MQQLKEFYERQETEELLEIAKKDLTDAARAVMGAVLASRGIGGDVTAGVRAAAMHEKAIELEATSNLALRRTRLLAFAIDVWGVGLIIYLLLTPLRISSDGLYIGAGTLLWTIYMLFRDRIPGQSIGKRMLGLHVQMDSGRPCTWASSFWRNMTHFFFGLDALFILGERRMRLGDLMAGTQVVRVAALQERSSSK